MPLYEFECPLCGRFEKLCRLGEAASSAACSRCQRPAARIVSAPRLARITRAERTARERNECAAEQPRCARIDRAGHGAAVNHGHGRPWMLGH